MNLQEFAALNAGDTVENHMSGSKGKVTERKHDGVMVAWGGAAIVTYFYSVNSTAWMHWSKAEAPSADDLERAEGALEDRARG